MSIRGNPLSIQVLGELNKEALKEQFTDLAQRIDNDDQARTGWVEEGRVIDQQLRGKDERKKKPWPHASDISLPLTKKLLKRWIPGLYNLVALADPVAHFFAPNADAATRAPTCEAFFDWLVKVRMEGTMEQILLMLNDLGSKGTGFLGVAWDYRTEDESRVVSAKSLWPNGVPQDPQVVVATLVQQYELQTQLQQLKDQLIEAAQKLLAGAEYVRITYRRVVADRPKLVRHDPYSVVVPITEGPSHLADYICLQYDLTKSKLREMARDGLLNAEAVEELFEEKGNAVTGDSASAGDSAKKSAAQDRKLQDNTALQHKPIRIHQVYCLLDKNGDGIGERVILWYAPSCQKILAIHDSPFSFPYWPVFRFDYEKSDPRPWMAHGLGTDMSPLQAAYNKQYRAMSDAIDIQLSPVFQKRVTSKFQPRTFKWGAGAVLEVEQIGDISPVEKSPMNIHEYSAVRHELKAFGEELAGSLDALLQSTGKQLERRTAFEVQALAGQVGAIQGMDSANFQSTMALVFQALWELWLDFGEPEIYYMVTNEEQPQLFKKSQHNFRYRLVPAGTPGNTNRQQQLALGMQLLQVMSQMAPDLMNREFLLFYVANLIDPRLSKQIFLPQAQQQLQMMLQQLAQQVAKGELPVAMDTMVKTGAGAGATPAMGAPVPFSGGMIG